MELTRYAQILRRWWYLALVAFLVTTISTAMLVQRQPQVYESDGTFVVRPRAANNEDTVRAFDTLVRGVEINATYAAIARSGLIRDRAEEHLDEGLADTDMSVDAGIVTGTNLLELTVVGENADAVHQLATALSEEIVAYIADLGDAYLLAPLDPPELPRSPTTPNRNLVLTGGVLVALALAFALPMGAEYIRTGLERHRFGGNDGALLDEGAMRRLLRRAVDRAGVSGQRLGFIALRPVGAATSEDGEEPRLPASLPRSLQDRLRNVVHVTMLRDGTIVAAVVEPGVEELRRRLDAWGADATELLDTTSVTLSTAVCLYGPDEVAGDAEAVRLLDQLTATGTSLEEAERLLAEPHGHNGHAR